MSALRILVTGGAGYVGSRVATRLLLSGMSVTVLDNLTYGAEALLPFSAEPSFRLIVGDVRDGALLRAAMRDADAVVHLAAIVGEPACDADPALADDVNRTAALTAIDLARETGVGRFVFLSTCSNYGVSNPDGLADERTSLRPLGLYARTKVAVESYAQTRTGDNGIVVLRLGTICGLSARMRFDLLVNDMARSAALGEKIEVYKPNAWRPYLHVADAAAAVETVLRSPRERVAGRVFNVVGENFQKSGLVELVRRRFPDANVAVTGSKLDDRDYRVSAGLIENELGFRPAHTVEEAFVEVADAVIDGVFVDPKWPGHGAVPAPGRRPAVGV